MMKWLVGAAAAWMMAGAPALAVEDDVTTPAGRSYSVASDVLGEDATIRFSDDGDFEPDGAGGRTASGRGYLSLEAFFCTARVDISWQIHVDADGTSLTTLDTSSNSCAETTQVASGLQIGEPVCQHGWDDLQPGETGAVCWADIELTREN